MELNYIALGEYILSLFKRNSLDKMRYNPKQMMKPLREKAKSPKIKKTLKPKNKYI